MEVIGNPLKYLIPIWIAIIVFVLLFKFNNWVDARPVKKEVKEVKKEETIKKIEAPSNSDLSISKAKVEEPKPEITVTTNYLYDRFVDNPTDDDIVDSDSKYKELFLSEDENKAIRDKKVEIKVKPVENLSEKELLYKKIEEMTNENAVNREKLLEEFDSLPRNTKLMLIENIIQKMN